MVQITFKADATTTVDLPDWAPSIEYATTGSGSQNLILTWGTTTWKNDDDDVILTSVEDLTSYDSTSIRLRDDLKTKPIVTFHYVGVGELVRTS